MANEENIRIRSHLMTPKYEFTVHNIANFPVLCRFQSALFEELKWPYVDGPSSNIGIEVLKVLWHVRSDIITQEVIESHLCQHFISAK